VNHPQSGERAIRSYSRPFAGLELKEIFEKPITLWGQDAFRVKLDAFKRHIAMTQTHDFALRRKGTDRQFFGQ